MKRRTSLFACVVFLFAMLPFAMGQDASSQQKSDLPIQILGPQLIAWSQVQKPQPVPQPLPPPDRPVQQQPEQQPAPSANPPFQAQGPAAQTFTGTIMKESGKYVLKMAGNSTIYQLDDQDRAKQYEGKQVKVAGTLDATGNSLHVTSIELIS